jgi:hypothetical protein
LSPDHLGDGLKRALRGLAARRPPRLLVILGASGAGKSSFLCPDFGRGLFSIDV